MTTKVIYIKEEKQAPQGPLSALINGGLNLLESSIARLVTKALPIRDKAK